MSDKGHDLTILIDLLVLLKRPALQPISLNGDEYPWLADGPCFPLCFSSPKALGFYTQPAFKASSTNNTASLI